ncbi:MAG: hypothetical protein AB7D46_01380 [Flavobacteriaceae bacterium]
MKKVVYLILGGLTIVSCSTPQTSTRTTKSLDIIGAGIIHKPVIAELDVKPGRVWHSKVFKNSELNLYGSENAKNSVMGELLKANNADVLVEPIYETSSSGSKTTIAVSGFLATYKSFKNIEEKDIKLLEVRPQVLQKADVKEGVEGKTK